jgi:hypothetical protein
MTDFTIADIRHLQRFRRGATKIVFRENKVSPKKGVNGHLKCSKNVPKWRNYLVNHIDCKNFTSIYAGPHQETNSTTNASLPAVSTASTRYVMRFW